MQLAGNVETRTPITTEGLREVFRVLKLPIHVLPNHLMMQKQCLAKQGIALVTIKLLGNSTSLGITMLFWCYYLN